MQRLPILPLLLALFAFPAVAQTQAAPTGAVAASNNSALQIISFSWKKYRPSRLSMETGILGADAGPDERLEDLRLQRQIAAERRRPVQSRGSAMGNLDERLWRRRQQLPEYPGASSTNAARQARRRGDYYRYSVELQNTGEKKVKLVEWDYVFSDPSAARELQRQRFVSKADIKAGKRKKLVDEDGEAPFGVVDVKGLGADQAGERVEIRRVVYEDGSVWEN